MINDILRQLQGHRTVIDAIERDMTAQIAEMAAMLTDAFKSGNKLLTMGNGGSAADAQHFTAEIVGRFKLERRALPSIALPTATSLLTATGND